jgi:hypothetical protein
MTIGPRRQLTFATLSEGYRSPQSSHEAEHETRQPGIRTLPFSYGVFKSICESFRVHESITKAITRSDVPSFSCEKVMMNQPAYGKQHLKCKHKYTRITRSDMSGSLQLSHIKFFPIRYGLICDIVSRYRSDLRHSLWMHVGYGGIHPAKTQQRSGKCFISIAYARYFCRA